MRLYFSIYIQPVLYLFILINRFDMISYMILRVWDVIDNLCFSSFTYSVNYMKIYYLMLTLNESYKLILLDVFWSIYNRMLKYMYMYLLHLIVRKYSLSYASLARNIIKATKFKVWILAINSTNSGYTCMISGSKREVKTASLQVIGYHCFPSIENINLISSMMLRETFYELMCNLNRLSS